MADGAPINYAPPRWLGWACTGFLLTGIGLFVCGPMISLALAHARVDATLTPEELLDEEVHAEALEQALSHRRARDAWVIPAGLFMSCSGMMGLLFLFVTRPLGGDLDQPAGGGGP